MNTRDDFLTHATPRMLVAIVDRGETKRLENILREKHVHFHFMFNAMGTAHSEILKAFGLSGTEKTVCICVEPRFKTKQLMTSITERVELTQPGNGIVFTCPISGISATISNTFAKEIQDFKERWTEHLETDIEKDAPAQRYELIIAVVNQGFSEEVMNAARSVGAKGGTIVQARRSDIEDAVKFFGVSLQAEKEVVAILIDKEHKKPLMQAISSFCGMKTEMRGVVIALPVESCAGLGIEDFPV